MREIIFPKNLRPDHFPASKCCRAPLKIKGHTTHYWVCVRCGKASDPVDPNNN